MRSKAGKASWGIGKVISSAGSILFRHVGLIFSIVLIVSLVVCLFDTGSRLIVHARFRDTHHAATPVFIAIRITNLIAGQILWITVMCGAVRVLRGQRAAIRECFSEGLGRFGPALGVTFLFAIGVVFGLLIVVRIIMGDQRMPDHPLHDPLLIVVHYATLLIVQGLVATPLIAPGLIIATMWAMAVPAAVIEKKSIISALSRSRKITRGCRWRVFGACLFAILTTILISVVDNRVVVSLMAQVIESTNQYAFNVVILFALGIAGDVVWYSSLAFFACVVATLYDYLRRDEEGAAIDQIAAVFD